MAIFVGTFTIFFYSPLERFFSNTGDFWFGVGDVAFSAAVVTVFIFCALLVLGLYNSKTAMQLVSVFLLVTSLLWYVQGAFLNPDLRVLDGAEIDWGKYSFYGVLSLTVWLIVYIFSLYFVVKGKFSKKIMTSVCYIFLLVQVSDLLILGYETTEPKNTVYLVSDKGLYEVSSNNNVVVFVLDAFDAQTFKEILGSNNNVDEWFSDFTWYPDMVAAATRTKISIPLMLSNIPYLKPFSYSEYKDVVYSQSPLLRFFAENHINAGIYTSGIYASAAMSYAVNNVVSADSKVSSYIEFSKLLYSFTAFTYMPQFLKDYFWLYTGDFDFLQTSNVDGLSPYRIDDVAFYRNLHKNDLSLNDKDSSFRFIHMMGPHAPFTMNAKAEKVLESTEHEQAIGALYIVSQYLAKMKKLGVYDDANIIITSDHGLRKMEQNPLMLVRRKKDDMSGLKVSDARVSHEAMHKCLVDTMFNNNFNFCFKNYYRDDESRLFYVQHGTNDDSKIIQFETYGHALEYQNFTKTGIINNLISTEKDDYAVGETLDFMSDGNGNTYTVIGFSKNEASHTWTDGNLAEINIPFAVSKTGRSPTPSATPGLMNA